MLQLFFQLKLSIKEQLLFKMRRVSQADYLLF